MKQKIVRVFVTSSGRCPYEEWACKLSVRKRTLADTYVQKISRGSSRKNIKALKNGLFEIKINAEGGIRVYFGEDGQNLILLLVGGDKGT